MPKEYVNTEHVRVLLCGYYPVLYVNTRSSILLLLLRRRRRRRGAAMFLLCITNSPLVTTTFPPFVTLSVYLR